MIVHGASRGQNNFTLNGANFTNYSQTAGFNPPPPDAVQEIRVQTSTFSAEFGNNAGAQVTMVTKAGSNQFHGSAWEFHRNDELNARNFFAPRKSGPEAEPVGRVSRRPHRAEQVVLLRLVPEVDQSRRSGWSQATVPTDAQRAGDFTGLATPLRNPVDPITRPAVSPMPQGRPACPANIINPDCISPVAKSVSRSVHPAFATGTVVKLAPSPLDAYNWVTRFDYTVSPKNNLFGHFFKDNYERISSPGNIDYVR